MTALTSPTQEAASRVLGEVMLRGIDRDEAPFTWEAAKRLVDRLAGDLCAAGLLREDQP